jgi:hypothetical protein
MLISIYQIKLINQEWNGMLNVFLTEYLMKHKQMEIEYEARHAWKWLKQKEYAMKKDQDKVVISNRLAVACCQTVCC